MIVIVVQKPSIDARLGLSLEQDSEGRVVVSRVSRSGLFGRTALRPGMEIVMVNDTLCTSGGGLAEVSRALQQANAGTLTLHVIDAKEGTAAEIAATPLAATNHDVSERDVESGAVEMLLGGRDGKVRTTLSQQQQRRQQQQDQQQQATSSSSPSPSHASPPQRNATRSTSYVSPPSLSSSYPIADNKFLTVVVPHQNKLGLRLQQTADHTAVAVKRIDPHGPFGNTDLRVGMRIVAVNDWECTGLTVDQVSAMFRQADREGLLTLLVDPTESTTGTISNKAASTDAEELQDRFQRYKHAKQAQQQQQPRGTANRTTTTNTTMTAMIHTMNKSTQRQPTGIRLKETPDRCHVRVDQIVPGNLAATQTPLLQEGAIVRKINGQSVRGWTVQQVAQVIRETSGTLTIHTKQQ